MARDDSNIFELTFAFLLGGLVGATVALLYAPASGEQTRRRIRQATDEMQDNVRQEYGRLKDKAEIEFSKLKDRASEGISQAKNFYEQKKARVRQAYDESRRALEEQQGEELATPAAGKPSTEDAG